MLRQVCSSLRCANICSSPASSCPVSIFPASAVHPRSSTEDLMKCCEGKDESKAVRLWGGGSKHHCKQLRLCPLDVIGLRKLYATWKAIWWRPKETDNREDNTTTPWPESILKLAVKGLNLKSSQIIVSLVSTLVSTTGLAPSSLSFKHCPATPPIPPPCPWSF